jgi:cell division protein FtsB
MGMAMRVTNWILVLECAYMEFSSWRGKNVYRRTVAYDRVVWC